jgi:hypothetical protein
MTAFESGMFDTGDANHRAKELGINNIMTHSMTAFKNSVLQANVPVSPRAYVF